MCLEIPLDQAFCCGLTGVRSGERTPIRTVRTGLRPNPHRLRRKRNRNMDSVHGHLGPGHRRLRPKAATTSRRSFRETGADVGSDRARDHLRVVARNGDLLERQGFGVTPGCRTVRRGHRVLRRLRTAKSNGVVVQEPTELMPSQLASAKWVPIGTRIEGSGNRVSAKRCRRVRGRETGVGPETRHRPPRRKARRAM